jgi:cytoskeletal protein CcmA (bactofilin family)
VEALEHKLTIGPNGTVHATVKAREVVALGSIHGNVEAADKIEIRKEAKLVGDIRTARIIIEDGAYFKGSIDIVKPDPAKSAHKAPPAPAQAPAPQAPVSAGAEVKR